MRTMSILMFAVVALTSSAAFGADVTVTSQLTGDSRFPENPEGIVVDVSIVFGDNDRTADWTVDLNSPGAHPDMKLDLFVFNLDLASLGLTESDVTPTIIGPEGWVFDFSGSPNGGGFGNVNFMFQAADAPGQPKNDVTNDVPLTFTLQLPENKFWSTGVFTGASSLTGDAGTGQLGAHLQSLTVDEDKYPGMSDSGFALGDYRSPQYSGAVPEPSALAAWSLLAVLGAAVATRRRKRRSAA